MYIVGLDNGSSEFGICVIDTYKKLVNVGTAARRTKAKKFDKTVHPYELMETIELCVDKNSRRTDISKLYFGIEEFFMSRGKGKHVLPWMQGFVVGYLHSKGVTNLAYVPDDVWKKHLLGVPRPGGKQGIHPAVDAWCRNKGYTLRHMEEETGYKLTDDSYDAAGIAIFLHDNLKKVFTA